jgi:hypothetical protein
MSPRRLLQASTALLLSTLGSVSAWAQAAAAPGPPSAEALLQSAERIGAGRVTAYRKGGSTLVVLPPGAIGKPMIWYTEVVGVPAGMVADRGLGITDSLVRLERVGNVVHVRDLGRAQNRRAATPGTEAPLTGVPGAPAGDPKRRPIDTALRASETGPLMASFPVLAAPPDGSLLVDLTAAFSNDIPSATGRVFVSGAGVVPAAVDTGKSYIESVRVRGEALNIRSHITYLVGLPTLPNAGPQPVSIVLGHSLVFLPDKPMAARAGDWRVGYFPIEYTEFESAGGPAQTPRMIIPRFRLEKSNPAAAVSDPIKPITYYLGPGIPERWKPYIRAGVLQWLPAFEAAGFSNAIRVLDAPTLEQDPTWSAEDVTINVIRWVTEERVNAMGPHVSDPRSGETLSAHIQIWPAVIDGFGQYYWALFGGSGVDPEAARLPLSAEKAGALLSYAVAHEVGHTLGLMHNQIASTAHSVAQMRNREFANRNGPNSSIMAYGRFNQAAQPGDGVTQLWGVIGPYDFAAIRYGYGSFGTDAVSEARELAAFADTFSRDRRLYWATTERGDLADRFGRDPRVQIENTGAERVEATRLGVANFLRSLARLDAGTGGDPKLFASTYDTMISRHMGLLKSVVGLVAGTMPPLGAGEGPEARLVSAAEQRKAVQYLLGEGAASLEPYAAPALVERVAVYGGYAAIDRIQAGFVGDLMNGPNIALLESQGRRDRSAYSSLDLGRDVTAAVWDKLGSTTTTRRALQRGYIDSARKLLEGWAKSGSDEAAHAAAVQAATGVSATVARTLVESGDDTLFLPWLRSTLPGLKSRLDSAARTAGSEIDRLHYADMSARVARLAKIGVGAP